MPEVAPLQQLPCLGVGASLSLSSQPDPVTLAQCPGGPDFVEYAGVVDAGNVLAEVTRIKDVGIPVLFHPSYINFCGSFENSPQWLEHTAKHIHAVGSHWFAQDCAYCFWGNTPGYSSQLGYFIPPILNKDSLVLSIKRIEEVQRAVDVPVAIEPPPMTFVVGDMPLFEFFGEIARQTGCALLLDMGHLVSYEVASRQKVLDSIDALPCEQVVEVHIAGGKLEGSANASVYVDAHELDILPSAWQMLEDMLPLLPNIKALCYECEGMDQQTVLDTLKKLRKLADEKSSCAELVQFIHNKSTAA